MKVSLINKRKAYTNDELINIVENKMTEEGLSTNELFEAYSEFFIDRKEVDVMLEGKIYFNHKMYQFLEAYLNIPINRLTKIVEDDSTEVSARGSIDTEFLKMLNYLFDQMIKHRKLNSVNSNTFKDYLKFESLKDSNPEDIVSKIIRYFNINKLPVDLFDIIENREGFYVLRFPNDLGLSGLTIIKNSRKEDQKYVCIYINTNEPLGRQKFTLAHEIYHVLIEKSSYQGSFIKDRYSDNIENKAEEFASRLIIPRKSLFKYIAENIKTGRHREFKVDDIVSIQNYFQVSFQSIVYVLSSSLERDERYKEYLDRLPKTPQGFKKYYNTHNSPDIQNELLKKIGDKTIFNFTRDNFEKPILFLNDIEKSYDRNLISDEEYNLLKNFFNGED